MANHVDNVITFSCESQDVQAEWDKLFTNYSERVTRPSYHGDGTIEITEWKQLELHPFMPEYDDVGWYSWGTENMGAKWANLEEADEDYAMVTSAWSPIETYVEKLYEWLYNIDETVVIRHSYEDEFRNFVGVGQWKDNEYESKDLDDGDFKAILTNRYGKMPEDFDWDWNDKNQDCPSEWYDNFVSEFIGSDI